MRAAEWGKGETASAKPMMKIYLCAPHATDQAACSIAQGQGQPRNPVRA